MNTVIFKLHSETIIPQDWIETMPMSGAADYAVSEIKSTYKVVVSKENVKKYLKAFGAWDTKELLDHDKNIDRLIWLATLDCKENNNNVFYMGE